VVSSASDDAPDKRLFTLVAEDTGRLVTRFRANVDHHNGQFLAPWALKGAAIMIRYIGFN